MVGSDWRGKKLPGFAFDWGKNEGMVVYSSPDLMNWTCHGNFCGPSNDPNNPLYNYALCRGPRQAPPRQRHREVRRPVRDGGRHVSREFNMMATAVADKPEGPYQWHGILQCEGKPMQGADTAVFTDDDGNQYLITGKACRRLERGRLPVPVDSRLPGRGEGQSAGHRRRSAGHLQARRRLLPAALASHRTERQR